MDTYQYKYGDRPLEGYTIQRAAGRGGFGEVYYAISDSGRQVAIKAIQSYEQIEVRGISQCMNLKSPHLVTIFDVRYNDKGKPFAIMEYVSGPSLADLLRESPGGLGTQKSAFFLREIGKGLSFLHECGIIHRDLKPGNIFYENGYVKIGDYGLTKAITGDRDVGLSQTTVVGTVHYMAPEMGTGEYDRTLDIYALGVVLYEMLTGQPPFLGSDRSEILMKQMTALPDLTNIEEPFARVIRKALAKDPGERYQSAQEMVEDVFGTEHVRNSVSQFSPEDLTLVAQRIAKEMRNCQLTDNGNQPDAGYFESTLAGRAITETQALRILNEWSLERPQYLSPLCEHAKLERVENRWAVRVKMEIVVEERSLEHETAAYLPDIHQHIESFTRDIWSIPVRPPESFVEKNYSQRASAPDQVAVCKKCNGLGKWVCPDCHGCAEVMCRHCDGTGKYKYSSDGKYSENLKCEYCHGAKKLPCTTCKGEDSHPCGDCGATGKVALYPIVKVKFRVEERTKHVSESGIEWDISDWPGILLDQSVAEGAEMPVIPGFIPATTRRRIEAIERKVSQSTAGRIHRTGMSFFLVPFTVAHLRYAGRSFAVIITGGKKGVLTTGWVPANRRRATGFYAGIPLAAIFSGGVIASSVLTGTRTLDATTGMILIVGASLGVLGSLGYLLWALLSKPKPKKRGASDAI